jgi:hypothetical protein
METYAKQKVITFTRSLLKIVYLLTEGYFRYFPATLSFVSKLLALQATHFILQNAFTEEHQQQ